jgi:hypothetical protein
MRLSFIIVLSILGICGAVRAADTTDNYVVVKSTKAFIIGPVGFAGESPQQELAFRAILQSSQGRAQFISLLSTSNLAGQLYALLGLKLLKDPAFDQYIPKYLNDKTEIMTMTGCEFYPTTVEQIARDIQLSKYK